MSGETMFRLTMAFIAFMGNVMVLLSPSQYPWVNAAAHLFFGALVGIFLGSIIAPGAERLWKKRHPKFCTSCGGLLKTYSLTSPDGKVHGSYKQCPRWVAAWNNDPVNCHNPPNKKRGPSIGSWSPYFSAPMPLPPGAVCFVHGTQVNLSCGSCLTYLRSKGVLDEDEVNHLLD